MSVLLLLALIWVGILLPPALRAHRARKEAFLVSFGREPSAPPVPPVRLRSRRVERRRRIAGGLLVAMVTTLLMGLLPTFRVLLVVHLFLVDSFLAYIALLAHTAGRSARAASAPSPIPEPVVDAPHPARRRWRRVGVPSPGILADLGPIAPV